MIVYNILLWLIPFLIIGLTHLCYIRPTNSNDPIIAILIFGALLHFGAIFMTDVKTPANSTPNTQFIISTLLNIVAIIYLGKQIKPFDTYAEYFHNSTPFHTIHILITFDQFAAISATNPKRWEIGEEQLLYIDSGLTCNRIGFKTYFDYLKYARMLASKQQEVQNTAITKTQTRIINSWLADIEHDKAQAAQELESALNQARNTIERIF